MLRQLVNDDELGIAQLYYRVLHKDYRRAS